MNYKYAPPPEIKDLCDYLLSAVKHPQDCRGDLTFTIRYLVDNDINHAQRTEILNYLKEHDGHCDCEVILNIALEEVEADV